MIICVERYYGLATTLFFFICFHQPTDVGDMYVKKRNRFFTSHSVATCSQLNQVVIWKTTNKKRNIFRHSFSLKYILNLTILKVFREDPSLQISFFPDFLASLLL